jgi:drug/metabolite transporter (DMT)-like permease
LGYIALALSSGVLLGIWKFGLSFYRGRISSYAVVLFSATAAAVAYVVLGALAGTLVFDERDLVAGLLGGACNLTGTLLLLKGYERGKVGVVTGIAASYVLVPLAYSFVTGEEVTWVMMVGVLVIMAGVAIFYSASMKEESEAPSSRAPIFLALGAALFWGLAILVLDNGTRVSVPGTLTLSQVPQVGFALVVVLVGARNSRAIEGVSARAIAVLAAAGLALALGNIAFYNAADEGDVGVVSVLASLSPLVTALLAVVFLREHLGRRDVIALLVVLVGTALVVV